MRITELLIPYANSHSKTHIRVPTRRSTQSHLHHENIQGYHTTSLNLRSCFSLHCKFAVQVSETERERSELDQIICFGPLISLATVMLTVWLIHQIPLDFCFFLEPLLWCSGAWYLLDGILLDFTTDYMITKDLGNLEEFLLVFSTFLPVINSVYSFVHSS